MDISHLRPWAHVVREVSSRTAAAFLILSLMLGLLSCSDNGTVAAVDSTQIKNVRSRLVTYDSLGGGTITPNSTDTIIVFPEETGVARSTAHGRCQNYYFGVHTLGSTTPCTSIRSQVEKHYVQAAGLGSFLEASKK